MNKASLIEGSDPEALLEWQEITAKAVPRKSAVCGIYFLLQGNCIVYVGQSINLHSRVVDHICSKKKVFDRFLMVEYPKKLLNRMEARYIAHFHPKYNVTKAWKHIAGPVLDMG